MTKKFSGKHENAITSGINILLKKTDIKKIIRAIQFIPIDIEML